MLKRLFLTVTILLSGIFSASAQTDSTDLNLFNTPIVLLTELDSILYNPETYEMLNLDFSISDTLSFKKVFIELKDNSLDELIFRKAYTLSDLSTLGLIESWDVSIPFGNLLNTQIYSVSIIIEDYSGALSSTIIKTLNP